MSKYLYLVVRKSLTGLVHYKATKYNYTWTRFPDLAYSYSFEGARTVSKRLNAGGCGDFKYFVEPLSYYI